MSFIKEFLEKRKEKKYGKGHVLGTTPTEYTYPQTHTSSNLSNNPTSSSHQSEAAKRAGEAALARIQQNQSSLVSTQKAKMSQISQIKEDLSNQNKELEKAMELKKHYFGDNKVVLDQSPALQKVYYKSDLLSQYNYMRFSKEEAENKIEEIILEQLDQGSSQSDIILVAVTLLFTANYKNETKLTNCIEIINKFVDNILNNPEDKKYRKIRVENAIFKEKVYNCKYSDLVLKKSGFTAKSLINEQSGQPEDFFVYEDSNNNFDSLKSLKNSLTLAEPIIPELDRDLKCFKCIQETSKLVDFQLSEEFFNLNIEELRREQAKRNEALEKAGMLRTKAMRERDEQLELRRYNYCLIRVKMPENFMLQCVFKTTEKFKDLCQFISENCLINPSIEFELVSQTLKKTNSMNEQTLGELGLAPASVLIFRLINYESNSHQVPINTILKKELI